MRNHLTHYKEARETNLWCLAYNFWVPVKCERNRNETKRSRTKRNETERNESNLNETEMNKTKN